MRRRERIGLVLVGLTAIIGIVLLLTYTGSHGVGPFSRVLSSIGARISGTEARYATKVRGHARADSLQWLDVYRKDPTKLKAPNEILVGAFDAGMPGSLEGVVALENALNTRFAFMHFYAAWGDKPEQSFPLRTMQAISELGSIPVITWEPWLTDFENQLHPSLPLRDKRERGGLNAVARGEYDFYIDAWAADAARYAGPMVIRFAHEMNDPYRYPWGPQNNRVEDFIAAWQHVVYRFRLAGAKNVLFAWAPHVAYKGFDAYYPGDEWVDWIATGVLNYGTVARWSEWWTFKQIFGEKYSLLATHKKPIMIAELGSIEVGGNRAKWYGDALNDLSTRYPLVKSVLFFNVPHDATVTYQALDWTFTQDSAVTNVVRKAINNHFRP